MPTYQFNPFTGKQDITSANVVNANSGLFQTGSAGTYTNYLFVKTSPSTVNQGGLILC